MPAEQRETAVRRRLPFISEGRIGVLGNQNERTLCIRLIECAKLFFIGPRDGVVVDCGACSDCPTDLGIQRTPYSVSSTSHGRRLGRRCRLIPRLVSTATTHPLGDEHAKLHLEMSNGGRECM